MLQTVRISSKRQVTIPVKLFDKMKLKEGDRLIFELENNTIRVNKAQHLIDELAGSVKLPEKYRRVPVDTLIKKARKKRFNRSP